MRLACTQHRADGEAVSVAAEMDLGGEAASRAPQRRVLKPPLSPAAQRCARTVVLSIICSASASPPPSASACSTMSHTPDRHHRRNCRQTEFQLPNTSGRSRHGAPVRLIQNTPSNTRRWFFGGRPPCGEGHVRNGSKIGPFLVRHQASDHRQPPTWRSASNHTRPRRGKRHVIDDRMLIQTAPARFFSQFPRPLADSFVACQCSAANCASFVHRT